MSKCSKYMYRKGTKGCEVLDIAKKLNMLPTMCLPDCILFGSNDQKIINSLADLLVKAGFLIENFGNNGLNDFNLSVKESRQMNALI